MPRYRALQEDTTLGNGAIRVSPPKAHVVLLKGCPLIAERRGERWKENFSKTAQTGCVTGFCKALKGFSTFSTAVIPPRGITFLAVIFLKNTFHPPCACNRHVGTFTSRC